MPLDIGMGIFGAIFFAKITGIALEGNLALLAILFSILPDVDFIVLLLKRKRVDAMSHEHRDLLHNPIIYIVLGFCILSFINLPIAYLFASLSLAHFIHDAIGIGWGIRWFYPFSKKYYKLFSGQDGKFAARFVTSWTPYAQRQAAAQFGDPNWLRHYFHGPEFLVELCFLLIAAGTFLLLLVYAY